MAQSVVVQKEKKVNAIFEKHGIELSANEFKYIFIEDYPKDWDRIRKVYNDHERADKKGKGHPMPHPEKYIINMYNNGLIKYKKK